MIDRQDLLHFGASVQPANVMAGAPYWKLVEARCANPNTEFGGDHHVYIEAVDENGQQLRNIQAQIQQGNEIHWPVLDKNLNEPGANWPLFRGATVFVSMAGDSDRVGPLHTERGAYKGGDLFHHAWYLKFQRTVAPGEPVVDDSEDSNTATESEDGSDVAAMLRAESWRQAGVASGHDSAFGRYAREHRLGAPVTGEYEIGDFHAQGFAGGIVYTRENDRETVQHMAW